MSEGKEATAATGTGRRLSPQEQHEHRHRILNRHTPSTARGIADAVVIKDRDLFFLCDRDGGVPLKSGHGLGLYYHDCRFLDGYELKLADLSPQELIATAARDFMAVFELTNPDLRVGGRPLIAKESIGIQWERVIEGGQLALHDLFKFRNFTTQAVEFPFTLTFRASFEDIFSVRGFLPERPGRLHPGSWQDGSLFFLYEGSDGLFRSLVLHFTPPPSRTDKRSVQFDLALEPQQSKELLITLTVAEGDKRRSVEPRPYRSPDLKQVQTRWHETAHQWLDAQSKVCTSNETVNEVLDRSLRDLHMLESAIEDQKFFAAGVPWFVTLFGRDSLITALQTLAYEPAIAEQTLRLLTRYQGQKVDAWRDEQPGKILHELRVGELARLGEIPQTPYYGSIDATPLFLILLARHASWTGDLTLFNDLRPHIEQALEWMARYGDLDGDGYLEYQSAADKGLTNQGWKDSGDAIVNADGSLARPPIALVEVQGYVYLAKQSLGDLYHRAGQSDRADQLQREAKALRRRFNRDFWLEDLGFYALALQEGKKPASVISSNPGQALWTGIVDPDKAERVMERLMAPDMFSGWGIRTLSEQERRYNPLSYHLGSVWPHDNSIIAAGFRRYGNTSGLVRIFESILNAARHYTNNRLPELFAGLPPADYDSPVRYPVACHPQAWAAGAVPFLVESLLGLIPEAFEQRLRIVAPCLPETLQYVEMRGLRIGRASTDLRFERRPDRTIAVQVLKTDGPLQVIVEPG